MKRILLALTAAIAIGTPNGASALDTKSLKLAMAGFDFVAPVVPDCDTHSPKQTGLIVYDLTDQAYRGVDDTGACITLSPLTNGVTSAAATERIERVRVASACSTSPCTITSESGTVDQIVRNTNGEYTLKFDSNVFASAPTCTCSAANVHGVFCRMSAGSRTATDITFVTQFGDSTTSIGTDAAFELICVGPRYVAP